MPLEKTPNQTLQFPTLSNNNMVVMAKKILLWNRNNNMAVARRLPIILDLMATVKHWSSQLRVSEIDNKQIKVNLLQIQYIF
jgi:hypothetical protein